MKWISSLDRRDCRGRIHETGCSRHFTSVVFGQVDMEWETEMEFEDVGKDMLQTGTK